MIAPRAHRHGARRPAAPAAADADEAPVTVEIDSLDIEGRGVARVEGKVVFVDGALPGERVRMRRLNRGRRYDTAETVEILLASPERVTPECRHFGVCGGCALQHLAAEAQLEHKQRLVAEQLRRIGRVEPQTWLAPLAGPHWGYRRRARLGARDLPQMGGVRVGFRERRSSYVAALDTCPVLEPSFSALLPALRELISGLSRPDRIPQIELAAGDDARALVIRHLVALTDADRERLRAFGRRHDLQVWGQPQGPDSVEPLWPSRPPDLHYTLSEAGIRYAFGPTDFVQVNAELNGRLVGQALDLLELADGERALDLYCGIGNFTLPMARRAQRVLGVESDAALVDKARVNAENNSIMNAEFLIADLHESNRAAAPWTDFRADKLLLDPPRVGAIEALKRLPEPGPQRIVYVSCYPGTLARDADYLVHARGYRLASVGVVDMFPHTRHVESMALFTRA